jgi:SH3 domain protein
MRPESALFALVLLGAAASAQETAYVTDSLQLGLHQAEDTSDRAFANLVSGAELTVLERESNYARVRTADGQEGWVRSAYLVSEKPATLRVAEAEAEALRLERELRAAITAHDEAAAQADEIVADAELELAAAEASTDMLARLQLENEAYAERMELYRGALPWPWVAGALFVALIGGFLAGRWWLDAAIRRRYGGFRMY